MQDIKAIINPLIVYPRGQGCMVADGRIFLKRRKKCNQTLIVNSLPNV